MSFQKLYDAVQSIEGRISTKWLREEAIKLTPITRVKEQWTSLLDDTFLRGFYVEGPLGSPVPLTDNQSMIVLRRDLDRHMRRLVYTKELMHIFDTDEEKTDTPEKLLAQAESLSDPTKDFTPQTKAEHKALARALAVLCQESRRQEFDAQIKDGTHTIEVVAASIQIPPQFARNLFRPDFPDIVKHVLND